MSLEPGQALLRCRIVDKLGEGGMGAVYRAEDTRLGREIAIKVMPAELAADAERRRRFEQEARAVAALKHPNIVTVYSVEEADTWTGSVSFITMELIEGRPRQYAPHRAAGTPAPKEEARAEHEQDNFRLDPVEPTCSQPRRR